MRSRRLRIGAQLSVLGAVVWFLILPQLRGSAQSLPLVFRLDNPWLPLALSAELGSLAAYTFGTRTMLHAAVRPPYRQIACIDLSSIGLAHCLPDGGAAGTALCWRLLVANGVPAGDAAFAKLAQGVASTVALHSMLLVSLCVGAWSTGITPWNAAPMALTATVLSVVILVSLAVRRPGFRNAAHRLLHRIPRFGQSLADRAGDAGLNDRLRTIGGDSRRLFRVLGWSACNWLLDAVALWASLRAFGAHVGVSGIAVAFAIACLGTWLPITPSGLGVTEGLMIPALIAFGATHVAAVLGVLTWRAVAYWLPIPIGAVAYGTLRIHRIRGVRILRAATADSLM